jgi:hypothetical protein
MGQRKDQRTITEGDIQDECGAGWVAGAVLMRERLKGLEGERMQNKITRSLDGTANNT